MSDEEINRQYEYYTKETVRLSNIMRKTKSRRIRSILFKNMNLLKEQYDWTYAELHKRGIAT
jgi:hypothetical protein